MIARSVVGLWILIVIVLSAGQAAAQGQPYYDVTSFGAKCDGSTNDTLAFQSAIAQAKATGGTIAVPLTGRFCVIGDFAEWSAGRVPRLDYRLVARARCDSSIALHRQARMQLR